MELREYQQLAIRHVVSNKSAGLFLDMGLGKTISMLTAVDILLYEELEINSVLVVAPKAVVQDVWTGEVEKWAHVNHLVLSQVMGTESARHKALKEKADVYLIGRDNIAWLCGLYGGMSLPFDMLIIDESSSFKSAKSIRFKSLRKVIPSIKRVVILSGTPAPNGLIDLWAQIYLLDQGARLGKTLTSYRSTYFKPGKQNGHIVYSYNILKGDKDGKDGEAMIYEKIKDICLSMKAVDYLDMPELVMNYVKVRLSKDIAKQYDDFEREQVLSLLEKDQEITAVNAAALSIKLLQFANGAIYDAERNVHIIHDEKLTALENILEEANGRPVLIAWTFKHDESRIHEKFKSLKPRTLKTPEDRLAWNRGEIQLATMHPASGGHGLNLQAGGNTIVWFGQTWSLELYKQLIARLYRQGQQASFVTVYHLMTVGTLDTDVIKSLDSKDKTQESLLTAIKARVKKYARN